MNIALIGSTGQIGREITQQLLAHPHAVTALLRPGRVLPGELAAARPLAVNLQDEAELARALTGHDVLVSAYAPPPDQADALPLMTARLVRAARQAGVRRVMVVGGAGSLYLAPGQQLVDSPMFPAAYKAIALAHREALAVLQAADDLDWTFFAPAALIEPGARRGGYRVGRDRLIADADGQSRISYGDYAEAFAREVTQGEHLRAVVTAAYA